MTAAERGYLRREVDRTVRAELEREHGNDWHGRIEKSHRSAKGRREAMDALHVARAAWARTAMQLELDVDLVEAA